MERFEQVAQELAQAVKTQLFIEVEASGRHVHLSQQAVEKLFGPGHQLTWAKELSQPGQYACQERITLTGPKGSLTNVVVLGPTRPESQVEISLTDALALGIKAPVRQSGQIKGSAPVTLSTKRGALELSEGAIVAARHIHMTPEDARHYQIKDGQMVSVKVFGKRPLIFDHTVIRISDSFKTRMHIDYDEANACGFTPGTLGMILQKDRV